MCSTETKHRIALDAQLKSDKRGGSIEWNSSKYFKNTQKIIKHCELEENNAKKDKTHFRP